MPPVPNSDANGVSSTETSTDNIPTNEEPSPVPFKKPSRSNTSNDLTSNGASHDPTLISYQDPLTLLDSKLQTAFQSAYDPDYYASSVPYNRVECFLLSWDEPDDDLKVSHEIDELTDVLMNTYHFNVTDKKIRKKDKKIAQTQINSLLSQWVDKHDCPRTLLLVYFAGHGKPGRNQNGELELAGHRYSKAKDEEAINLIVWNRTENLLQDIQSDVLQIFDCCYAGYLGSMRGTSNQAFEYIAACAADRTTAGPGPRSFTTALIWALRGLAEGGPFTTVTLLERVRQAVGFPTDQEPTLSSRRAGQDNQRIVLQPLSLEEEDTTPGPSINGIGRRRTSSSPQDVVTLKLMFDARPTEDDVKKLAKGIGRLIHTERLVISRAVWGGIKPQANNDAFATVVMHLLTRHKARQETMVAMKMAELGHVIQEEIQEQVREQVVEEAHNEFVAFSAARRSQSREPN